MKRLTRSGTALLVCAGAVALSSLPAYAIDDRHGSRECNSGYHLSVSSTTSTAGSPSSFAVAHVVGSRSYSWSQPGYHTWDSRLGGVAWQVSTTGTITSAGTGCHRAE